MFKEFLRQAKMFKIIYKCLKNPIHLPISIYQSINLTPNNSLFQWDLWRPSRLMLKWGFPGFRRDRILRREASIPRECLSPPWRQRKIISPLFGQKRRKTSCRGKMMMMNQCSCCCCWKVSWAIKSWRRSHKSSGSSQRSWDPLRRVRRQRDRAEGVEAFMV